MNPVLRFVPALLGVSLVACSDNGITAPKCDRCNEMRVLTDRPEYRPGSKIAFTITNRTQSPMRYDWCSVELVNRRSGDVDFTARYLPARRCGVGAGATEVVQHMVVLAPGENVRDSVSVSGAANQAQYRLHVWIVDENGIPEGGNPVASNVFDVFPSAQAAISK